MQLQLNKQELLNLGENLRAVKLYCRSGCCWLTQAGDDRDHILRAGHSRLFTRPGKVLVMAITETQLQLTAEPAGEMTASFWRKLWFYRKKSIGII
jgi:hypothetical protein